MEDTDLVLTTGAELALRAPAAEARDARDAAASSSDPWVRSDEWADRWLLRYADGTREQYSRAYAALQVAGTLIDRAPLELDRLDIEAWVQSMRVAGNPASTRPRPMGNASLARMLASVSSYFDYCLNWPLRDGAPWLERNPVPRGKDARPRPPQESAQEYLDPDMVRAMTARADQRGPRDAALLAMLTLALRVSDACNARVEDLSNYDGHRRLRVVGKGEKVRYVAIPRPQQRRINAAVGDRTEGPILATRSGLPLGREEAWGHVRAIATEAEVPLKRITPHTFRHAAITAALKQGVKLQVVQAWAGHADPRTTERYDRLMKSLDDSPSYVLAGSYFTPEETE